MKRENLIIVFSAPSGVGKTTVIQYLMSQREDLTSSVSATHTETQTGERGGIDITSFQPRI
jgi:guanylate kinase